MHGVRAKGGTGRFLPGCLLFLVREENEDEKKKEVGKRQERGRKEVVDASSGRATLVRDTGRNVGAGRLTGCSKWDGTVRHALEWDRVELMDERADG